MSLGRCGKLRDPAVAAAARAAAPLFFAWRQRRKACSAPPAGQAAPRRRRPERLRDRVRAISHRISKASRCVKPVLQQTSDPGEKDIASGGCLVGAAPAGAPCRKIEKDANLRSDLLKLDIAPPYLRHIARRSRNTAEHFERIFTMKGLIDMEFYLETMFWAIVLDDLVIRDSIDFMRSSTVERVSRFLFAMELALRPVTSVATLERADWEALKVLQLERDGIFDISIGVKKARMEARKRASRRARLNKLAKRYGGSNVAFDLKSQEMKEDWYRDWSEIWDDNVE